MRKLLHKFFNRIVIAGLLMLIQAGILFWELVKFSNRVVYISTALELLSVIVVFSIIYKKNSKPAVKLAWIVPILLFPLFGGLLYLTYGSLFIPPKNKRNMEKTWAKIIENMTPNPEAMKQVRALDPDIATQFKYVERYAPATVWGNTSSLYFEDGAPYWKSLLEDIEKAEKFIFLEYFIIGQGKMWQSVLDILLQKVKEGVEVRVIYDDFGSALTLPNKYFETMEAAGIKCIAFNRIIPFFATILNYRDHRKIVVIDGKVAYTGGMNLSDEYVNIKKRFGYWKDSGLRLEGDGVWNMTVLFLQNWNSSRFTDDDFSVFRYNFDNIVTEDNSGFVVPFGDSPMDNELVGENVYVNMINNARDYVWIFTPYLIIDDVLTDALKLACKRGVDVRIVTPGIPDKKSVYYMTRCSYLPLMEAGVRIFEYTPGFIHSKCTLCDDELANIGTINYDYRSLYHHFECSVLLYKTPVIEALKSDMEKTFTVSREVTEEYIKELRLNVKVLGPVLHLFAPML